MPVAAALEGDGGAVDVLGIDIGGSGIKGAPVDLDKGKFVEAEGMACVQRVG